MNQRMSLRRIAKQQQALIREPIKNITVRRQGNYNFHFVIYGLDGDYQGGYYHGMLELHPDYPFAAPKLYFYTPNGRFHLDKAICTSYTNYHPQSWTAVWNIRTMIQGTVSFMTSHEGSYGVIYQSSSQKKELAKKSMQFNLKNEKFRQIFQNDFKNQINQQLQKWQNSQIQKYQRDKNEVNKKNKILDTTKKIVLPILIGAIASYYLYKGNKISK